MTYDQHNSTDPRNILLASAIGDALGKPFEMMRADNPKLVEWVNDPARGYLSGGAPSLGPRGEVPGAWTDDTGMTVALADALLEGRGYLSPFVFASYKRWFDGEGLGGAARGTGGTIRQALREGPRQGWRGVDRRDGGQYVGNGGAMRVSPIGVYFHRDFDALCAAARGDAILTHDSAEAEAGSVAIALAVAHGVNCSDLNAYDTLSAVLAKLRSEKLQHTAVYAKIGHVRTLSMFPVAAETLVATAFDSGGNVADTVATALYFGTMPRSFKECITASIAMGGDTDTRTAIVGAIRAPRAGCEYPDAWMAVEERETLLSLGAKLYGGD